MRHRVFGRKLNRDIKERKALFKSLIISLITYGRIKTTVAKAKAIRGLVEKLVTRTKDGTDSAFRQIASFLTRKEAVEKLTKEIMPRFTNRVGGYVRIRRLKRRSGDNTEEAILEWTVGEEKKEKKKEEKKEGKDKK